MEGIEYNTCLMQQEYWEQKITNAKLEEDYWHLKIQKLKEGDIK